MSILVAWVAFPAMLAVLSLGCGQVVKSAAGGRIPAVLVLPAGFAAYAAVTQLATMNESTARLAAPAVVAIASVGGFLSWPWRRPALDRWPVLAALGVFAVFGAPVVLSGSATFTGWIKLDDAATWLAIADRMVEHGRNIDLAPSTYHNVLAGYIGSGYPAGSFVPLGVAGQLVREDIAWLMTPYYAFLAAMLALAIYSLSSRLIERGWLRALTAFIAAQASTFLGYALWGGMKEVFAAALIALVAALVPVLLDSRQSPRAAVPLGVATAATLGALSVGGGLWLAPILVPALWLVFRERGPRFTGLAVAWYAGVTVILSLPTLFVGRQFTSTSSGVVTGQRELGNLFGPLKFEQILGIWPTGDFRVLPRDEGPTYLLIGIAAVAVATAVLVAARRRRPELVLYLGSALVGAVVLVRFGSPWIDGKALATASPALVAAAMVGGAVLFESKMQIVGVVVLIAVAGGVIWSNVLQLHDVDLAPRAELAELSEIGSRFAGQGPALMTEYSVYGARHFLRQLDPESASEFRVRLVPLLSGVGLDKGASADIDAFQTDGVLVYPTLVLRRSATASRPPSVYKRVWRGSHYEVWQRPTAGSPQILEHLPLGTPTDPSAVPDCAAVMRLAALAGPTGRLVAVGRPPTDVVDLSTVPRPTGWVAYTGLPGTVAPDRPGTLTLTANAASRGPYSFWLGGGARDRLDVGVDGKLIYSGRVGRTWPGTFSPVGTATLEKGPHTVTLHYYGPGLSLGSGGMQFSMGPLVLGRQTAPNEVENVAVAAASSLCGRRLDWIEAVRG